MICYKFNIILTVMSEFNSNIIDDEKLVNGWDVSISDANENNVPRLVIVDPDYQPLQRKKSFF